MDLYVKNHNIVVRNQAEEDGLLEVFFVFQQGIPLTLGHACSHTGKRSLRQ